VARDVGDVSLAGLPPQAGLYACLFGGLVFWLLCSSRHTSISVASAISLLIGSSLASISGGDPAPLIYPVIYVIWKSADSLSNLLRDLPSPLKPERSISINVKQ
jgi:MFS superfamily sulfate permease-like transporter